MWIVESNTVYRADIYVWFTLFINVSTVGASGLSIEILRLYAVSYLC